MCDTTNLESAKNELDIMASAIRVLINVYNGNHKISILSHGMVERVIINLANGSAYFHSGDENHAAYDLFQLQVGLLVNIAQSHPQGIEFICISRIPLLI